MTRSAAMTGPRRRLDGRVPVCYLAPWVDYGGSDKGTIDWFRWLDRDRFAPFLITTQPSDNRRLGEIFRYAEEVWPLPDFLAGQHFPTCIFDLIDTRGFEVLHIMNSRMAFDLLPDLAALSSPPKVVVQLHVEEPSRDGYVRYVTTRYGNLVDAFSVSSEHLARTVEGYDINSSKIRVIPTGVDTAGEFNPSRVAAAARLAPGGSLQILFPGRLADQKNPLLMIEVLRALVGRGESVHVHIVGDGPLEPAVRSRVKELGLERHCSFHPPTQTLARWFAACDLLLMTSVFEGVPYVVYEAMAMELPIVAPALPGNAELMADTAGILVAPDAGPETYAGAVRELIGDPGRARLLGKEGRRRVQENFDVRSMAALHGGLYAELLSKERGSAPQAGAPRAQGSPTWPVSPAPYETDRPLRFLGRPLRGQPLVSVVVPCFNHGRFLNACVDSILEQDYEELEVIVVDDASTDETTLAVLEELAARERVRVIHLSENSGPSVARNAAVREAQGRYVLPVDSDNVLLPGAVASLVEQIQAAGEDVGYIYPNCQYFGTRDDCFQPPSFNLALLLSGNYCDTCSLIDREVFDAGLDYPEDIGLGHEDWDFVLTLAEHGVRGEPARADTLLYRKHGFTRSDAVEYAGRSFHEEITERHPGLYGRRDETGQFGRWSGPAAELKARFAPGLSILVLDPVDLGSDAGAILLDRLQAQTSRDFELVLDCPQAPSGFQASRMRRIPPTLCPSRLERLQVGLGIARAARLMVAVGDLAEMLQDATFLERMHRTFWAKPGLDAIALTDAGNGRHHHLRLLDDAEIELPAHALVWQREAQKKVPQRLLLDEQTPCESLARAMSVAGLEMQWRQAPGSTGQGFAAEPTTRGLDLGAREDHADPHRRIERKMLSAVGPALPALSWDEVRRWLGAVSWMPPGTEILTRHRRADGTDRILKLGRDSPPGYVLEFDLGAIQRFAPPGTVRLVLKDGAIRTVPRGSPRCDDEEELGHLEAAPLPLFVAAERAVLTDGSETLIAGPRDPLQGSVAEREFLGFLEAFPNEPSSPPDARRPHHGRVALLRYVDLSARRHFYATEAAGGGRLVGELGALHLTAQVDSIPVLLDEHGFLGTDGYVPEVDVPDLRRLSRWVIAPLAWKGFGQVRARTRAAARRGLQATQGLPASVRSGNGRRDGRAAHGSLLGYLYPDAAPGRRELFSAVHPLTGDQLLTTYPLEAADMGYGAAVSLGYMLEQAPATGTLALSRVAVPWASRFGLEVRRA